MLIVALTAITIISLLGPRLELNTSHTFNPSATKQGRHYYFHFADEETDAQWGEVICQGHSAKRSQVIPLLPLHLRLPPPLPSHPAPSVLSRLLDPGMALKPN